MADSSLAASSQSPAAASCDRNLPLAPADVKRVKTPEIDLAVSLWEIKYQTGAWVSTMVLCAQPKSAKIKTDADAKELIADMVLSDIKKNLPGAKIDAGSPLTVGDYSGTKYSVDLAGAAFVEVRVVAKKNKGYAIVTTASDADLFKQRQKTADQFEIRE